ncbi:hypothetical protein CR105_22715 [Massilia eurypsychrophila]|uniref:Autotransporter domain-containing protein n=2 Tax=Massilia eurypsychrophila TaxID=1485217 RepID=A0A2G8T9Q3_9BURK|nr:hypothetical protein CR105_22715 [Massilia eurypsychrophila]
MSMHTSPRLLALLTGAAFAAPVFAQTAAPLDCQRSFAFRADTDGVAGKTVCSAKADAFIDALDNFNASNAAYTPVSSALVQARFSDVGMVLSYDANSTRLNYNFIELGDSGSFTGASRAESQDQFEDFVKKSNILARIMQYQAQHSATSPITGIGGVITMAGAQDFGSSFDTMSKIASGQGASNNLVGVGLNYGSYSVSGSDERIKTTSVPLSYTVRNDIDPRRQLVLSVPITLVSIGGAQSVHGSAGVAYRLPLSDNWTLTPGARYAIIASKDRATLSSVMSASLTSTYAMPTNGYTLGIGNMIGYYKTGKFSSGDYSIAPDIALTMMRNGIMASMPTTMFGPKMAAEISLIDMRYLGDKPFVDSTQEIGFTIGTNRNAANARSFVRGGLSYLRGRNTRGLSVNFGYWF